MFISPSNSCELSCVKSTCERFADRSHPRARQAPSVVIFVFTSVPAYHPPPPPPPGPCPPLPAGPAPFRSNLRPDLKPDLSTPAAPLHQAPTGPTAP